MKFYWLPKLAVACLKAYNVTEKGPVRAVDGVNLQLSDGKSACGKSTLGAALMRSMQPPGKIAGGSVMFDGTDLSNMPTPEFNSKIGWKK